MQQYRKEYTYPFKTQPYDHQFACWNKSKDEKGFGLFMEMGCVCGDAKIVVNTFSNARRMTLAQLHAWWHGKHSSRFRGKENAYTRSMVDGELRLNRIVDVLDKGIRETIEFELESGIKLCVTPDHEMLSGDSWPAAETFQVGDFLTSTRVTIAPRPDKIVAIRSGGMRQVFDVVMEDPGRNFLANGVVVHNCGKSWVIVNNAAYLHDRGKIDGLLVIAPKGVYLNWELLEIPNHMPNHVQYTVASWYSYASTKDEKQLEKLFIPDGKLHILLMNVEAFSSVKKKGEKALALSRGAVFAKKFLTSHRTLAAIDESTTIKHESASRTKTILGLRNYAEYRRILSGEPAANNPLDVYSQFEFLEEEALGFGSYFAFRNRFAILKKVALSGKKPFYQIVGHQNLDHLQSLIDKMSFTVKKDDCLDLPERTFETRFVEMGEDQRRAYTQMKKNCMIQIETALRENKVIDVPWDDGDQMSFDEWASKKSDPCSCHSKAPTIDGECQECGGYVEANMKVSSASIVITQLLRLHQVVCGFMSVDDTKEIVHFEDCPRYDQLLDDLEMMSDSKVVIFATYRPTIEKLKEIVEKKFGEGTVQTYYGGTPKAERATAVARFQDPKSKVRYFITNKTGAYGITLTAAKYFIFFAKDYDNEVIGQARDRVHRIGQTQKVLYLTYQCPKTVDVKIDQALTTKEGLSDLVTPSNWRKLFE